MILDQLEPLKVFKYFEEITKIPHGSGNEKEISDYLVTFAEKKNLWVHQDSSNNVIIKKPGTKGKEKKDTVIIQGHMDMVCEKNSDICHDFLKDPLDIFVDGDYIGAKGTTLGGDDGIAVAYALALLDSDNIEHPPLEVVITTDEEAGMKGAFNLDTSKLNGKYIINIDSEKEGELLVSCAGGAKVKVSLPIKWDNIGQKETYKIVLKGLKGGHSGEDINKNRCNSNKMMGRILYDLSKVEDIRLVSLFGGAKDNAIPRECEALLIVKEGLDKVYEKIDYWNKVIKKEYNTSDPNIKLELIKDKIVSNKCMDLKTTLNIIDFINICPNKVQTMSSEIKDLPESSLNLGVITTSSENVDFTLALRSSKVTLLNDMKNRLEIIAKKLQGKYLLKSEYPAWEYKTESKLRELFIDVYKEMYNKKPGIKAIHAGLECGIFASKMNNVDIISIGPNMKDIHTPNERLSISSTKRTWEYVINILKRM